MSSIALSPLCRVADLDKKQFSMLTSVFMQNYATDGVVMMKVKNLIVVFADTLKVSVFVQHIALFWRLKYCSLT